MVFGTTNSEFIEGASGIPAHWRTVGPFVVGRGEAVNRDWMAYLASRTPVERTEILADHGNLVSEERGRLVFRVAYFNSTNPSLLPGELFERPRPTKSEVDWRELPATVIPLPQALAWAQWRGVRLCTEEEWELAARGSDGRVYPHGDALNAADASWALTQGPGFVRSRLWDLPGRYPRSRSVFGVDDMVGNVAEPTSTRDDQGSVVVKSGSWGAPAFEVRADYRKLVSPSYHSYYNGFRWCAD